MPIWLRARCAALERLGGSAARLELAVECSVSRRGGRTRARLRRRVHGTTPDCRLDHVVPSCTTSSGAPLHASGLDRLARWWRARGRRSPARSRHVSFSISDISESVISSPPAAVPRQLLLGSVPQELRMMRSPTAFMSTARRGIPSSRRANSPTYSSTTRLSAPRHQPRRSPPAPCRNRSRASAVRVDYVGSNS